MDTRIHMCVAMLICHAGVASCLLGADISDADVPENDPDGNAYDTHAATYPYAYALYEATVSVLDGVIGLNTTAGLEIISEAGDEITIKGPLPYINRAIGKLHYTSPTSSYNDDTLTVTVSDAGYVSGAPFTSSSGDSTAPSSTTEAGIEVSSSCTINRTLAYDSITFNWPSAQTVMTVNEDTDLTIAVDIPSPSLTRTVAVHLYTTFGALSLANGDAGGNGNVAWASSTVAPAGWTASSDDSYTDLAVSGTMNAIAVELAGLVYHPVPDMNGVDYLTVVVDGVDTHILKVRSLIYFILFAMVSVAVFPLASERRASVLAELTR